MAGGRSRRVLPPGLDDLLVCLSVLVFQFLLLALNWRGFGCANTTLSGALERVLVLKEYKEVVSDNSETGTAHVGPVCFAYENLAEIDERRGWVGVAEQVIFPRAKLRCGCCCRRHLRRRCVSCRGLGGRVGEIHRDNVPIVCTRYHGALMHLRLHCRALCAAPGGRVQ